MLVKIEHIEDVLPHIHEDRGIIVSRRPDMTVIDYVFTQDDTFDTAMAQQCRGLKFDADGRIIARPFHKFFNLGEREDPRAVDWTRPHVVMDKLDGTMIHPAMLNGRLTFMTRMGATKHAAAAAAIAGEGVLALCREQIELGRTPMFEFTAPENRIVVAYDAPALTLLAVREMTSGAYVADVELRALADRHGVPAARAIGKVEDGAAFWNEARALEGVEGYVIAFEDGHRIKVKADAYVLRHRALAGVHLEKNVLAWVVTDAVDDVTPLLAPDIRERVLDYQKAVEAAITARTAAIEDFVARHRDLPRKDFAALAAERLDRNARPVAFAALDGNSVRDSVRVQLRKATHSQTKIDQIRGDFGFAWSTEGLSELELG